MDYIVLVEDGPDWIAAALEALKASFAGIEVSCIYSESEFVNRLDEFRKLPPKLFVLDVMLPWSEPSPDMPDAPEDVKANGFWRAGVRCQRRLTQTAELNRIPAVFWTIISRRDMERQFEGLQLPPDTFYVSKDGGVGELVARVREIIG